MNAPSDVPVIEVEHLYTRYGSHVVHEDISLSVRRGEVFALVGGSGSGKSTLLREIVLLTRPAAGSIRVLGQEILALGVGQILALRKRIGVLFQRGALFSSLTVAENVMVPMREHARLPEGFMRELAALKIALVGLPADSASKYPSELSGGMIKRAALARAIALDPELLFLDEPSAGLDPVSAGALDELITSLKELLGLTVIMVTHDLDSLWQVADRVAMLGEGRLRGLGTVEELYRSEDPLVRAFFHGPRGRAAERQASIQTSFQTTGPRSGGAKVVPGPRSSLQP
jgi:phospholipid/cholesterol/gamma-HCH transport system ATP-binding protein